VRIALANEDVPVSEGGWGWPAQASKPHYFEPGEITSICRKWMFTGLRTRDNGVKGPDDCAACHKKLEKRKNTL
jgi:hypothetical protein